MQSTNVMRAEAHSRRSARRAEEPKITEDSAAAYCAADLMWYMKRAS